MLLVEIFPLVSLIYAVFKRDLQGPYDAWMKLLPVTTSSLQRHRAR